MTLPLPTLQDLAATRGVAGEAEGDGEVRGSAPAVEPAVAGQDLAYRCDGDGEVRGSAPAVEPAVAGQDLAYRCDGDGGRTRAWRCDAVAASGDGDGNRVRYKQLERTVADADQRCPVRCCDTVPGQRSVLGVIGRVGWACQPGPLGAPGLRQLPEQLGEDGTAILVDEPAVGQGRGGGADRGRREAQVGAVPSR